MIRKVTFYWILLTLMLVDSWLLVKTQYPGKNRAHYIQVSLLAFISANAAYGLDGSLYFDFNCFVGSISAETEKVIKGRFKFYTWSMPVCIAFDHCKSIHRLYLLVV